MTIEELQEQLNKAANSIQKLEAKNEELIGKLKTETERAIEATSAREAAAEKAEREAKDVEALEKRLTAKFEKQLKDLTAERDTATAQLRTTLVDNEIAKAIRANNVRDGMDEALTALFQSKHKFENGEATIEGKPISDYVAEYVGSERGAFYRRPTDNSGAGATGNTTKSVTAKLTKRPTTPDEFNILDAMETSERNAFLDSINAPDLKL